MASYNGFHAAIETVSPLLTVADRPSFLVVDFTQNSSLPF